MNNLSGKKVLVTNAGVGFGQDIVVELARLGARVAAQADLRASSECDRTVEEAAEALGGLDVLVNNPGVPRAVAFLAAADVGFTGLVL